MRHQHSIRSRTTVADCCAMAARRQNMAINKNHNKQNKKRKERETRNAIDYMQCISRRHGVFCARKVAERTL